METIGKRLARARLALGYNHEDFGELTGVPVSTLKKYEGAHREPGSEALRLIAKAGIDLHWLVTGQGEMLRTGGEKVFEAVQINEPALAAILAAVEYAKPDMSASERVAQAVQAYVVSLREGLITSAGPGLNAPSTPRKKAS